MNLSVKMKQQMSEGGYRYLLPTGCARAPVCLLLPFASDVVTELRSIYPSGASASCTPAHMLTPLVLCHTPLADCAESLNAGNTGAEGETSKTTLD